MGGSASSKEETKAIDKVKQIGVVKELMHPMLGKFIICNCEFNNGQKGLAYKKEMLIESLGIAQKLLEYSKRKDSELKNHFINIFGYTVENYSV